MLPDRLQAIADVPSEKRTIHRGIEKEGLRVTPKRRIGQNPHPTALGSALKHPHITTDYSEALLEFVTPVCSDPELALGWLADLHRFTLPHLGDQVIWSGSMPCRIDSEEEVKIAQYGSSNIGRLKTVYRHGLWHRYGRVMQSIAGLHYNVSFDSALLESMADREGSLVDRDWQSAQYFHVIRNFRRHQYLLAHLFGASPAFDASFNVGRSASLPRHGDRSHLLDTATSLRMSDIGYTNHVQSKFYVCFNALLSFVSTIDEAMNTSHPVYEAIGVRNGEEWLQLNTHVLQIENEYYSDIRPKRVTHSGERPSHALLERGVEYLEVRCMDLNPFAPNGVDLETMRFLDLFLTWCWVKKSPHLTRPSCKKLRANQLRTTQQGASADLVLERFGDQCSIRDWGLETLDRMGPLAEIMEERYPGTLASLDTQKTRLKGHEETLSQRVVREMRESGADHVEFLWELSKSHKAVGMAHDLSQSQHTHLSSMAEASHEAQRQVEAADTVDFEVFVRKWM